MTKEARKIVFTVINDLSYDRRMDRICTSLAQNGFSVTIVGRILKDSKDLEKKPYSQKRIKCWFTKGMLFYGEYNLRLLFYLLFTKVDVFGAVDLDTILAHKFASFLRNKPMVYDAHEYFTEVIEIQEKTRVKAFWKWVEKLALDEKTKAYTVSSSYAKLFEQNYGAKFEIVRNCPVLVNLDKIEKNKIFTFIYVGAINEGRGIEQCIEAIKDLPANLRICGDGDILNSLKKSLPITQKNQVSFTGYLKPSELELEIQKAHVGLLLLKAESLSYVYSLANKFFDYVHAEIPQITIDFPEYVQMNQEIEVAKICTIDSKDIREKMQFFLGNSSEYDRLVENTIKAKQEWNWQKEEKKLVDFYNKIS